MKKIFLSVSKKWRQWVLPTKFAIVGTVITILSFIYTLAIEAYGFYYPMDAKLQSNDISSSAVVTSNLPQKIFFDNTTNPMNFKITNTSKNTWNNVSADIYATFYVNPKINDTMIPENLLYLETVTLNSAIKSGHEFSLSLDKPIGNVEAILSGFDKLLNISAKDYILNPTTISMDSNNKAYLSSKNLTGNPDRVRQPMEIMLLKEKLKDTYIVTLNGDISGLLRIFVVLKGYTKEKSFKKIYVISNGWSMTNKSTYVEKELSQYNFMSSASDLNFDIVKNDNFDNKVDFLPTKNLFSSKFQPTIAELNQEIARKGIDFKIDHGVYYVESNQNIKNYAILFMSYGTQEFNRITPVPYGTKTEGNKIQLNNINNAFMADKIF